MTDAQGNIDCANSHYADQLDPAHPRGLLAWVDPSAGIGLVVDYPGEDALWLKTFYDIKLGTTCDGSVTERPLKDGRAEVSVVLHTRNTLVWATTGFNYDFMNDPLVFGCRWTDLAAGGDPALVSLGDCTFQLKFINTAPNALLPDIIQLLVCPEPGQEDGVLFCSVEVHAKGPLRAAFGVPDGTLGMLETAQQNWLAAAAAHASPNSMLNRFSLYGLPGKIQIRPIGSK